MPPQQAYRLLDLIDDIHDFIAHRFIPLKKFGPSIMFEGLDVKDFSPVKIHSLSNCVSLIAKSGKETVAVIQRTSLSKSK
jgi:hypothetical protein